MLNKICKKFGLPLVLCYFYIYIIYLVIINLFPCEDVGFPHCD